MENNEIRIEAQDLNQQGATLLQAGNIEAARAKLEKAIDVDPMLMDSYKNYGDLCMKTGEYQEAKNYYKKAMLIEKQGILHFLYGHACFMNDDMEEGLEHYNMALSAGYDSADVLFFVALAYEHMNDDEMALRYFQKACAKSPARTDFTIKKISCMLRMNMLDTAEEAVDELLITSPELYDAYHMKTHLLAERGAIDEAIAFAEAATKRFPEDVDLMLDYVRVRALNNELDTAMALVDVAKQMKYFDEAKKEFAILEAEIAAEKQDFDYAEKCCEYCIELEDEDFYASEARFMLMNLKLNKKDYEAVLELASEMIAADKGDLYYFAAVYFKPYSLKQLGRDEEAVKYYKEANMLYRLETLNNPAAIDVYLYRAMCLKDLEEYDKAMELLDFILALNTEIAEVYSLKADIYRSQGRNALADEELEKAYKIKPELRESAETEGE